MCFDKILGRELEDEYKLREFIFYFFPILTKEMTVFCIAFIFVFRINLYKQVSSS